GNRSSVPTSWAPPRRVSKVTRNAPNEWNAREGGGRDAGLRPVLIRPVLIRPGRISTGRISMREHPERANTRSMTTRTPHPPTLSDPGTAPERTGTALADRTGLGLLHQRILLLDRELDQDNGAQLCAGLLLLAAEDPRKRPPPTLGTVPLPHGSSGFGRSPADIELQAEDLRANRDLLIDITAERTGRSRETIARDSERDHFWDAEAAVEYGFCDRVITDLAEILPLRTGTAAAGPGR